MVVSFPKNTKQIIDEIRHEIGRVVTFVYVSGTTACTYSGCSLDPTTGLSTNSFCPVCSGKYYIPNILESGILAHITWNRIRDEFLSPAGMDFAGKVRVQIEYTDEHRFVVENMKYMIVDGKKFERDFYDFRGVPEINRIVIIGGQLDD